MPEVLPASVAAPAISYAGCIHSLVVVRTIADGFITGTGVQIEVCGRSAYTPAIIEPPSFTAACD